MARDTGRATRREVQESVLRERLQLLIGELREMKRRELRVLDEIDAIADALIPLEGGDRDQGREG
ncbi:MAG: hypothetical protein QMD46_07680 [Methanomicrobiales archaeon]|nr:hypothetical protein [Methanomicrobiales archaeon]MDI6877138.1 hypothetical protein [Methanomicrobiales archaeon]